MNKQTALETLQAINNIVGNLQPSNLKVVDAWALRDGFAKIAEFITKQTDETTP